MYWTPSSRDPRYRTNHHPFNSEATSLLSAPTTRIRSWGMDWTHNTNVHGSAFIRGVTGMMPFVDLKRTSLATTAAGMIAGPWWVGFDIYAEKYRVFFKNPADFTLAKLAFC